LLLVTTVDDRAILLGKFAGMLRRCLPVWCVLFGHVIFFSLVDFIHPIAVIQIGILVVWVAVFLTGAGVYFSSCFRRTTTAVMMNFALAAVIWGILPLLMAIVVAITRDGRDLLGAYMDTNPFVHAFAIMVEGTHRIIILGSDSVVRMWWNQQFGCWPAWSVI
jgi:hypothetical protein